MRLFKNIRIDRLLFGSFAAFIAALLMLFTWLSYSLTSRELADNTFLYQQDVLNELNKQLDIQLRSIEQMSLAAARNMVTVGYDPLENDVFERLRRKDDLLKLLASITYSTTMVQSIDVFMEMPPQSDPQGPVHFKSLQQVHEMDWYPQIQKNDFAWIPEHTLQTNTGPQRFISFVRKMYNNSGKYEGLLMLNVKSAEIEGLIRGETTGRNRILLNASGTTISMIGDPVFDARELESIQRQEGQSNYIRMPSAQGDDVLLVWNKARSGWMLVEVTPWRDVIHGSVRLAYILVFTGLSAIFLASFFTLFISKQFTKPIRQLVSIMSRVPAKGAMADLPGDYTNEFGYLFNGYRRQMERIDELLLSLETQHKRQKEAEILALQAMINPHFLYNTLDQLNWLAIESGQEKMSKILSLVGKMFRIGLSNGATMIPVQDEMTHVECYLEIQKIRWGDRLTYSMIMDEEMKEMYMPRITLQPFVENAFIHGFHGRRSGDIRVEAHVRGGYIEFHIEDNGVGLQPGWEREKPRKTGGYGIRNVKERIAAYVGTPYGITMQNLEGKGTRVTILLPIIKHIPEAEEQMHVENSDH